MMLVHANVLMYAAGAPHPNRAPSVSLLRRVASGEVEATIDAGMLQEILHRASGDGRRGGRCTT